MVAASFLQFATGIPTQAGHFLHSMLAMLALLAAVNAAPRLVAGAFCEERRNQTLGLLFLTGLRGWEVFLSKVLSSVLLAANNLLALTPFLALPLLMGGVSFSLFTATIACLPTVLGFAVAVTLLASSLCKDESAVLFTALALGAALTGLAPALGLAGKALAGATGIAGHWLLASPAYGPWLVCTRQVTAGAGLVLVNCAITWAWSFAALAVAAFVMRRSWQDRPDAGVESDRRWHWREWLRGSARWRGKLARRWLDENPIAWLVLRDRLPVTLAWVVMGATTVLWLGGWAVIGNGWISAPNGVTTAVVLNGSLHWLAAYGIASRLGEDRRTGSLELLLTTPLSVREVLDGVVFASRERFRAVARTAVGLNLLLLLAGLISRDWPGLSLATYGLLGGALLAWAWRLRRPPWQRVLWVAINSGRPSYAVWRCSKAAQVAVVLIYLLLLGPALKTGLPSGSQAEFIVCCGLGLVALLFLMRWREVEDRLASRLRHELRDIAQELVPETSDPRFKRWPLQERLPVPVQEEILRRLARRKRWELLRGNGEPRS